MNTNNEITFITSKDLGLKNINNRIAAKKKFLDYPEGF